LEQFFLDMFCHRVSKHAAKRWTFGKLSDWALTRREKLSGKCLYVGGILRLSDLEKALDEFQNNHIDCEQVVFRAHAKGIENLARHCGMVAVVEDVGDEFARMNLLTGKRFCGDKGCIASLVVKLNSLRKRYERIRNNGAGINHRCNHSLSDSEQLPCGREIAHGRD
jgi:hypothetical protein